MRSNAARASASAGGGIVASIRSFEPCRCHSFVPGAPVEEAENACRAALYSPYSALFREQIWGGIPISLFAVGAFSFFVAFSLYLLMAGDQAPRRAHRFLGMAGLTPLAVSILMAVISATKLGAFCKTCTGIYIASG